jgi:putative oxidoreductase
VLPNTEADHQQNRKRESQTGLRSDQPGEQQTLARHPCHCRSRTIFMIDASTSPYAALALRIGLGLLFLAHGDLQIRVYGLETEAKYFRSLGLPGRLVYLTAVMQVIGGIALVAGVYARFAALLLLPIILGTIVTVHAKKGWLFTNKDGGWEYPAFWALALLVQFLLGDGAWALLPSPSLHELRLP